MPLGLYTLDDSGCPKESNDTLEWGRWFENPNHSRHVGDTTIGPYRVSTVFLGIDHSFSFGKSAPVLWETMIFGRVKQSPSLLYQERYTSKDDALDGHKKAVDQVSEHLLRNGVGESKTDREAAL